MKIVKRLLGLLGILILLVFLADGIWVMGPVFMASKKLEDIGQYAQSIEEISLKKEVKIVGLGEASHGNKEFQSLKLDLLKNLVEKEGVRSFALETDFGEGMRINNYIHGMPMEEKSPQKLLSFTIYQTKEMKDLISWMYKYNQKAGEEDKLSFYGYDMQNPKSSVDLVLAYSRKYGLGLSQEEEKALEGLKDLDESPSKDKISKGRPVLDKLERSLNGKQDNAPTKEKDLIVRSLYSLLKSLDYYEMDPKDYLSASNLRDKAMAENIQWIQEFEEKQGNGPILIAGHNGHIGYKTAFYKSMGAHLKEAYQDGYYAIGTDYFKTRANISHRNQGSLRGNHLFYSADPLAWQAKDFSGRYFLDFSKVLKGQGPTPNLIENPLSMGSLGESYVALMHFIPYSHRIAERPKELYSAMIFYYEVSPTNPTRD